MSIVMPIYTFLEALVGLVGGILLAVRSKKAEGVTYGKLDQAGRITNVLLIPVYVILSPLCLFVGLLSAPAYDGFLGVLGWAVSAVISSALLICGLGLGWSVALRKKGKSKRSFAVQFAGLAAVALMFLLFSLLYGNLLTTLN